MSRENLGLTGAVAVVIVAFCLPFLIGRTSPTYPGKTTIRFLTYETGHEQQVLVHEIIDRFEKENPDIHVEPEFNARGRDKIYVEMASGTAPDVIYAVTDDVPKMALRGGIIDVLPYMKRDKVDLSPYFSKVSSAMIYNGKMYGFAFHYSTDVLFYNKDIFDQAGIPYPDDTWDYKKWIEVSQKLTKKDAKGNTAIFGTVQLDPVTWMCSYGVQQFNSDYTKCTLNCPLGRKALMDRNDFVYKYHISPSAEQLSGLSSEMLFTTGRVAMMPGRTYMVIDFNKQITNFKYDVAPIPKGPAGRVVRLAVGGLCITSQCKHREAAWRFLKFYASEKGGLDILGHEKNCVPGIKKLAYSPKFFLEPPPDNGRIFVDSIKDAQILTPPILQCSEYQTRILNPTLSDIGVRLRSVDDGLKIIEDQTNELLKQH